MKKVTLIIWLIIFGFIALLIFQNQDFFMTRHSLRLNLGVVQEYQTPELPIAVAFIVFFVAGLVIAYLFNFSTRFKARRTHKKLNAKIASHQDEVSNLKRELDTLKGVETPAAEQADETKTVTKTDSDQIIELTSDRLVENPADQPDNSSADNQDDKTAKVSEDETDKKQS